MVQQVKPGHPTIYEEAGFAMENGKECLGYTQPLYLDQKKPAKALAMSIAL